MIVRVAARHSRRTMNSLEPIEAPPSSRLPRSLDLTLSRPAEAPLISQLRGVLAANLRGATLDGCARAMHLSGRTLQRRLRSEATSFQNELCKARVRAGKHQIRAGRGKLTHIALEVGCASLQHFSLLFRTHTGMPPSAWRARLAQRLTANT